MSKRLIDVCTPHVSNLRMKDLLKEGPYPCFGAAGLAGYRDTFDSSVPYVGVIKDGAGVGRANVYPAKSSLLGTMESLIPSGGNDPYFLMYLLRSRNLGDSLTGSTIPHIYFKDYGKMRVPDFDRDQQRRVAVSLGLFEKSIALKNKELGEMDSLVKSRFIEMFFNSQKFVEEPLGKNVIQMNIGPFGSDLKKDAFVSKDNSFCMVYEQKHAIDKTFSDNNRFINHQTYEKLKRFAVGPSDIIVTCRGTIGKIYVLPKEASIGIIHPSLMMIRLNRDIYEPTFFSFLLQKELYAFQANGATIAMGIKASELSKRKMIVPPMNRQKDFVDYYQLLDKSGFVIRKQIENLQELLNSKMDEYFGQ